VHARLECVVVAVASTASQCVDIDRKTLLPMNNACSYASWGLTPDYCPIVAK